MDKFRWDDPIRRGSEPKVRKPAATQGRLRFEAAVERWVEAHQTNGEGYKATTKAVIRANLLGGRMTGWRAAHEIDYLDQWTADLAVAYMTWYQNEVGAHADTVRKVRTQLRQFARYCEKELGHDPAVGPSLTNLRISRGTADQKSKVPAFTKQEAEVLISHAAPWRDRLIVTLLLYTGMRPSELVALEEQDVLLDGRTPLVRIVRSIHDPDGTKTPAGVRSLPLTLGGQRQVLSLMRAHLEDPKRPAGAHHLFPAARRGNRAFRPLSIHGLDTMLARLSEATGIHANAYRFRHTFATWQANAGQQMTTLQTLMGHATIEMTARYFRGVTNDELLQQATRIRT